MSETPPEKQCTMPSCSEPVADGRATGGLCQSHIDGLDESENGGGDTDYGTDTEPDSEWEEVEFTNPENGVWASDRLEREQWMGHIGKRPFAPWGDRNYRASCTKDEHDADTTDECDCDARWKWGITDHYVDGDTIVIAEDDPRLDGRAFLQREHDPFAYVDGDDVRDPETGKVHPAFVAALERLGFTYADVSQSDSGVHASYRGELPDGVKQAAWQLNDEPWGANDDLPSIEIYAGKRVCVDSGQHVPGTPTETRAWDDDNLRALLDENDQLPEAPITPTEESFDAFDYDASATASDETADDIRDVYAAIDRLDPKRVAEKTIVHRWNDDASTSDDARAFVPTWGRNSNGTANIVNDQIWQDTGDEAGYGGPVVMALIDAGEMSHRNASPRKANGGLWLKGIEHLRELGFDIPQFDPSASGQEGREFVATLPNSPRTRAAANGRQWTDERASGDATLSQQDVYDRVRAAIDDAMQSLDRIVLDAIMGGGKTYNFFGALADRDEQGAYFAPRIELYEQAVEYAEANGIPREKCYILPSIKRHCPTWAGEHGEDQEHLVKTLYYRGVQPKTIHNLLGDELGCCKDGKCEYEHRCDFDEDEYQVLIGHYAHAHLPHVTAGRHCAFDEDPQSAFTTRIAGPDLIKGVNAFLDLEESPAFDGWDDLIQHRNDAKRRERGLAWFDRPEFEFEPDERNAVRFEDRGFHAYAPLAVYTILSADPLEEGYPFETASLPGFGDSAQFFTTSDECGEHYVELATPPDLEYANAIVALDGTPLVQDGEPVEWKNALNRRMNYRRVLTDGERAEFLAETQGNVYIQASEHIKPYSSGRHNHPTEDAALLAAVRESYGDGDPPVVFTGKKVRDQYEEAGFVEEGLAETFDHPGNLRGSDEYGSCRLAVQLGSSHHGDHAVGRRAAMLGETVAPEGKGKDRDYGSELGNKLVYQMREAQSAQNALRVGRDGHGSIFVFDTCAVPDWMPIEEGVADVSTWSEAEQSIREAWSEFSAAEREGGVTTAAVSEAVGTAVGERHTRTCLDRLASRGYLETNDDPDDGRRVVWADTGLAAVGEQQAAEIGLPEIEIDPCGEDEEHDRNSLYVNSPQLRLHHTDPSGQPIEEMSVNSGEAETSPDRGVGDPGESP